MRSISERTFASESGRSLAVSDVRAAIMPQPMSTPTAAGMIAPTVAMTLPTVAPLPWCTSGIPATHLWMNGSEAMRCSWARASASNGTPLVHDLMGAPPGTWVTSYGRSVAAVVVASVGSVVMEEPFSTRRAGARRRRDLVESPGPRHCQARRRGDTADLHDTFV